MPNPNDMLTPAEARDILNISRNTMYKLIRSGKIKAELIGAQYRIRRGDLPGQQAVQK